MGKLLQFYRRATSEGDFHEALNIASVWELPVMFVIENNGYGLSTPTNEQYRENLADKGKDTEWKVILDGTIFRSL
jgi:TPP-dependent pyruvate/acetoin dehydrogenase alpha subunit